MTTLTDKLNDLVRTAIEANEEAFSENKDADQAQDRSNELIEQLVWETAQDILNSVKRFLQ